MHVNLKYAIPSVLLSILLCGLPALGQNRNSGEIRGTVTDTTGAVIPAVVVDAENLATGIHMHATTSAVGQYDFPYISPGSYNLSYSAKGFKQLMKTGIVVHVQTMTVDAVLQPGSQVTTITVTQQPALIQTETSQLNTTLTQHAVSNLPLVGGNWLTLTQLIPGATPAKGGSGSPGEGNTPNSAGGENVSVNGSQAFQSSWLVDGGVASLPVSNNPDLLSPPVEAVQEIDMVTHSFGAEYGNGLATFNVILKSGTNRFHGSLYEFNQNDIFNAAPKNWSAVPEPKPAVRFNMFGGTIGGPVLRNRLFFYFAFQKNPTRNHVSRLYTFPTDAMRKGDFSGGAFHTIYDPSTTTKVGNTYVRTAFSNNQIVAIDPVAAKIQQYFPEPNAINPADPYFNNYYFSGASQLNRTWYLFKVDGNLGSRNHISASAMPVTQYSFTPSPDCPIDCGSNNITEWTSQLTDTWTISNSLVNDLRVAMAREALTAAADSVGKGFPTKIGLPNLPSDTFPAISMSSGPSISIGANAAFLSFLLDETAIAPSDTLDWVIGKHEVKMGVEYDNWTDVLQFPSVNAGSFNFNGIDTRDPDANDPGASPGVGYADFLLGGVQSWSVSIPPKLGGRVSNVQLFAQDYYKILPTLTLNYGARLVLQNGWHVSRNAFANYDPNLMNPGSGTLGALAFGGVQIPSSVQASTFFLAPRAGFSWSVRPSWVIRGGFGLYPIPWGGNDYLTGRGVGYSSQGDAQSIDNVHPVFQLSAGNPPLVVSTPQARTPSLLNGQSVSYAPYHTPISYEEQFQFGIQHQMGNYAIAAAYVGSVGRKLAFSTDINQVLESKLGSGIRPNPTYQAINATQFNGESNYNALQVTAKRRLVNGIQFLANYTWSKALDTGTGSGGNGYGLDAYQNAYSPSANYAASANDVRQSLSGSALYQLPFGRGDKRSGLYNEAFGGWRLGSIFQAHSGTPFTPVMASNLSGALAGKWFPNRVGPIHVAHPNTKEWFNVAGFAAPAPFTFGNSRRNVLYGPNFVDVDMNLGKSFALPKLGDEGSLEFRVDSFDVLNHPNYGQPDAVIGSAGAGMISSSNTNRMLQLNAILKF